MERAIKINDKEYKFRSNASMNLIYRQMFGRDLLRDFQSLGVGDGELSDCASQILSDVAYMMAKMAKDEHTEDQIEWLSQFEFMEFYNVVIPEVFKMWQVENRQLSKPKK